MARQGRAWFRRERRRWHSWIAGRLYPLDVTDPDDRAGAEAARARLVAELAAAVAAKLRPDLSSSSHNFTVAEAVAGYLAAQELARAGGRIKANSLRCYRVALKPLAAELGSRVLAGVTGAEFEAWAARPGWSNSTRASYLTVVLGLLRWAGFSARVRLPPRESRGAETCLSDDQFARVLAALPDRVEGGVGDLKRLLVALRETGARPQELAGLTAESVDWENGCAQLTEHKGRRHTARRVVYFNGAAMAVLADQRALYGSGLLFRTRFGNRYAQLDVIRQLGAVSKRLGFRVIAYGLGRHSFATRALVAGVPDAVVAELLGHRGTAMITNHYGHLAQQSRVLREAAEKASGRKAG